MLNDRCFALSRGGNCQALAVRHCPGCGQCAFFKAKWVQERDLARINVRLNALPEEKQLHIAEKYYHGEMPWRKEPV